MKQAEVFALLGRLAAGYAVAEAITMQDFDQLLEDAGHLPPLTDPNDAVAWGGRVYARNGIRKQINRYAAKWNPPLRLVQHTYATPEDPGSVMLADANGATLKQTSRAATGPVTRTKYVLSEARRLQKQYRDTLSPKHNHLLDQVISSHELLLVQATAVEEFLKRKMDDIYDVKRSHGETEEGRP